MSKPEETTQLLPPRGQWVADMGFEPVTDDTGAMVFRRYGPRGGPEIGAPTYLSNERASTVREIVRDAEAQIRQSAPSCNIAGALAELAQLLDPNPKRDAVP